MGFGYLYLISFKIDGFGFDFTCGGGFLRSWTLFRFSLSLLAYCVIDSSFVPFGLLVLDYLVGRRRTQLQ